MSANPWVPSTTSGGALLDEVREAVRKFCVLPSEHAYVAVTLWIAATYTTDAFDFATRLVIRSPEKRSGKTRLMEVIAQLCWDPLRAMNATVAAIFRSLGGDEPPPTLLIDEADTIFGSRRVAEQNEDLRGLLNAGYQRGTPVLRTVGPQHTPTKFPTFAMTALAGIGTMPDTIEDRAVVIAMRRRKPSEQVRPYRIGRDGPELQELQVRLSLWAIDKVGELTYAEPQMPVEDRAADVWEPLVAIADAAGGTWPAMAREACRALTNEAADADADDSLNVKLLGDIRAIFAERGSAFIGSQLLVNGLCDLEESPWREFELNPNKLSRRLRQYRVRPGHDTTAKERGYRLEDFVDAFERYLPTPRQESSEDVKGLESQGKATDGLRASDTLTRQTDANPSDENPWNGSGSTLSDEFGQVPLMDWGQLLARHDERSRLPGHCSECAEDIASDGHLSSCSKAVAS